MTGQRLHCVPHCVDDGESCDPGSPFRGRSARIATYGFLYREKDYISYTNDFWFDHKNNKFNKLSQNSLNNNRISIHKKNAYHCNLKKFSSARSFNRIGNSLFVTQITMGIYYIWLACLSPQHTHTRGQSSIRNTRDTSIDPLEFIQPAQSQSQSQSAHVAMAFVPQFLPQSHDRSRQRWQRRCL